MLNANSQNLRLTRRAGFLLPALAILVSTAGAQISPQWQPFISIKPDTSRVEVLQAMGQDLNPYTRKVIVGALIDPSRSVVDTAVHILRGDHCAATFHALISGMPRGDQYDAALILADYRQPQYLKQMFKLLRHEQIEVRRPIALALGMTGAISAVVPLKRATKDPNPDVRQEAERALQRLSASLK